MYLLKEYIRRMNWLVMVGWFECVKILNYVVMDVDHNWIVWDVNRSVVVIAVAIVVVKILVASLNYLDLN